MRSAAAIAPPPKWKAYMDARRSRGRVRSFQEGGANDDEPQEGMSLEDFLASQQQAPDADTTGAVPQQQGMSLEDFLASQQQQAPDTTGQVPQQQGMSLDDFLKSQPQAQQQREAQPDITPLKAGAAIAARGVLPALGGLAAIESGAGAGAVIGAGAGTLTGPLAPVAVPTLGFLGGLAGGGLAALGAGAIINKAQDWVLDKLGLLGSVNRYTQAAQEQQPVASTIGELVPMAAGMKIGDAPKAVRALYGLAGAGWETGSELARGEQLDPLKIGGAGAVGALLTDPNKLGRAVMAPGRPLAARLNAMVPRTAAQAMAETGEPPAGRPDLTETPTAPQEKADAQAVTPPDHAQGTAPVEPPPNQADVAPTEMAGTRSEREYPKDMRPAEEGGPTQAAEAPTMTQGNIKPDVAAAISAKANPEAYTQQRATEPGSIRDQARQQLMNAITERSRQLGMEVPPEAQSLVEQAANRAEMDFHESKAGGAETPLPRTPEEIDPNKKVQLPTHYRGTGAGQGGNLNVSNVGDIGRGVYLTPNEGIARSYGGGPEASVSGGTRVVDPYSIKSLYPEEVAYVFGGRNAGDDVSLVSGNGIELWKGPWSGANIEAALAKHDGIKAVVGTPDSIGLNQVAIRDPSILNKQPVAEGPPRPGPPGAPPEPTPPPRPQPVPAEPQPTPPAPAPAPPETTGAVPSPEDVPGFLRRGPGAPENAPVPAPPPRAPQVQDPAFARYLEQRAVGAAKDAAARQELEAQQTTGRQAKTAARIGKMKAAQAGETTRMPLTGKAALEAIRDRQSADEQRAVEAPKTSPAERAVEAAKIEHGTSVDDPNWLPKAAKAFIADEAGAINYQQFLKMTTQLGGAWKWAKDRYAPPEHEFQATKARGPGLLGKLWGSKSTAASEAYARKADDRLHNRSNQKTGDQFDLEKIRENMPDADKAIAKDAAAEQAIYRARERSDINSLPEEQQTWYKKYIKPTADKILKARAEIQQIVKGLSDEQREKFLEESDPDHVYRMAERHRLPLDTMQTGVHADPMMGAITRGLGTNPGTMRSRKYFALEGPDGERRIMSPSDDGKNFTLWDKYKQTPGQAESTKLGSTIDLDGKQYTVKKAYTSEIQDNALFADGKPAKYIENALGSVENEYLQVMDALRNARLLRDLKADPEWNRFTLDTANATQHDIDVKRQEGWRESAMPQLKGTLMHPDLSYAFDNYSKPGFDAPFLNAFRYATQGMLKLLYLTPIPHSNNGFWHWWVGKGFDWIKPAEYRNGVQRSTNAWRSVMDGNDYWQKLIREHGGGTVEGGFWMQDFQRRQAEAIGIDYRRNPAKWEQIAEQAGFGKGPAAAADLVDRAVKYSGNALWTFNDILYTEQVMHNVEKGMSPQDAVAHAAMHIPNYRMPLKVMGSRILAQVLGDAALIPFGRYHAGMYSSLARMVKGLAFGRNADIRKEAAGQMIAAGVATFIIKPYLDQVWQWATGDENAKAAPRGPMVPILAARDIIEGKAPYSKLLQGAVTLSPPIQALFHMYTDMDATGHRIVTPGSPAGVQVGQYIDELGRETLPPYGTVASAVRGNQNPFTALIGQFLDFKIPSEAQARWEQGRYERAYRAEDKQRAKKPQGPAEWLMRQFQ